MSIGLLFTAIFVVLKLLDKITWSWWWVVSPTLIEIALCVVAIFVWIVIKRKR
jgi:hypothetical protein